MGVLSWCACTLWLEIFENLMVCNVHNYELDGKLEGHSIFDRLDVEENNIFFAKIMYLLIV